MTRKKIHIIKFCLLACALLYLAPGAKAQYTEYETKASIIYYFGKYVTWPTKAFGRENKIVLGILGDDPFGATIDDLLRNRSTDGRSWKVVRGTTINDLKGSHIIFIGRSKMEEVRDVITEIYRKNNPFVLTIGDDIDGFCKYGGIINFREGKHYFNINLDAATSASLTIDAKLLQLAKEIVTYDNE